MDLTKQFHRAKQTFVCVWACRMCLFSSCSFTVTYYFNLCGNPHRPSLFFIILTTRSTLTNHYLLYCAFSSRPATMTTTISKSSPKFAAKYETLWRLFHCIFFLMRFEFPVVLVIFFQSHHWALHLFIPKQTTAAAAARSIKGITFCVPGGISQEKNRKWRRYRLNHGCVS